MSAGARRSAGNLPAELTSFVGRRRDLGKVRRLLSAARLVTLTGTGGIGKTRLALRAAAEMLRAFPDGVWLVQLADLRDPHLLANSVAITLGLRGAAATNTAGLAGHLQDKQLLLVLDNCEHMADECATLVGKLLAACEGVRILATSRHVLHVEGEHVVQVQPLAVPPAGKESAGPSDAVTLFVERAAAVLPGFELTPGNRTTVIGICERLEGIPLAIELAAVRMRALSADQLLQRLDHRLSVLAARPHATRMRQRTLEAAIDWSFELCSPAEQRLWARLSVFPGGFDLEAAEQVCAADAADRRRVLGLVTGLVDKSVLSRQDGTSGRQAWYRMLETVREYAGAKLSQHGDEPDVRARQVEHYVNLTRTFATEVFGRGQLEWLARMGREHANLRAVLEHCLSRPERASQALDIASTLWRYWYGSGHELEGHRYLRRGLKLYRDRTTVRAQALYAASFFAILSSAADVRHMLAELAVLAEELDDERLRAGHAECSGMARNLDGDLTGGADLLERALAGFRWTGDEHHVFDTLILLANVRFFLADPRGAAAADEALAMAGQRQAHWSRCWALWAVATHRWRTGEHQQAAGLLREAIALRLADRTLLGFLIEALAWCSSSAAEHDRAARLLGCAHAVWRLTGARIDQMSPYRDLDEQCAAHARSALGAETYDAAFADAAGFDLDEVIRYALREKPPRSAKPGHGGEPSGLTKREQEIAELVARGMSNRDIATALVIGRRTVESHIENILAKLGFTSRTQVTSWLSGRPPRSP
ncbi:LuxR C-terminal-related transcriptional regulator [Lentzea sp. NPDC004782]|uniref:LuxR C-terminal-related transcriptional regulator n=1 Tax=Lentzea sp. NPDC004782 TaxID=3154458 RepID=UPI0033BF8323